MGLCCVGLVPVESFKLKFLTEVRMVKPES